MTPDQPSEQPADESLPFGEKLLGMQSFNTARAQRYRAEMEKLLVHRIAPHDRWTMGFMGVFIGIALTFGGIEIAFSQERPELDFFYQARWTFAIACILTGLFVGGWLLKIGLQGGYARRLGDVMGLAIVLFLGGGVGTSFIEIACGTQDQVLRMQLLSAGGVLLLLSAGSLVLALLQRMHRQTHEKLLRIEYHLAELMERAPK